jgi:hypothetical protein
LHCKTGECIPQKKKKKKKEEEEGGEKKPNIDYPVV